MSLSPLRLSKDYIPIEKRVPKTTVYKKRSKWERSTPLRDRFILFHGKGDKEKGLDFLDKYWDRLQRESLDIIYIVSATRSNKSYGNYIGVDPANFTHYKNAKKVIKKKFWSRLIIMHKIVKNYDEYKNETM